MPTEQGIANYLSAFGSLSDYLTDDEIKAILSEDGAHAENNEQEIVKLLKERAGLKMHCAEYKRKYKALNRILRGELFLKIEGLKTQQSMVMNRLRRESDNTQREMLQTYLKHISSTRSDLEYIYKLCVEVSK